MYKITRKGIKTVFFKLNVLKKLFKDAYKGAGLTVGCMESKRGKAGYYISSGWWVMWFGIDEMPKEVKAAVIELSGELPEVGEVFKTVKDMGNQYEVRQEELYDLPSVFERCCCNFRITRLLLENREELLHVIQEEGRGYHVCVVREAIIKLINKVVIDRGNGECPPNGPRGIGPNTKLLVWGNETCYLGAGVFDLSHKEEDELFLKSMEKAEII